MSVKMSSINPQLQCREPNADLFDQIFPNRRVANVPQTSQNIRKDTMQSMRPKNGLDYKTSQTYTKFDVGDKKISFRFTETKYEKKPVEVVDHHRVVHSRTAPACQVFLEDILKTKIDEHQKKIGKILSNKNTEISKKEKKFGINMHQRLQRLVGPKWFQELSPKQLAVVENLKTCIDRDLFCGTIVFCQDLLAKLGLVLRPNHRHIEKALKNCCGSPEEFLLLLYQLINPKRTEYSINDRLLLSAVVHLSMEKTLRELHVRIPSPPPPRPAKKPLKKRIDKPKPVSPYLEKMLFVPREKKNCLNRRIYRPHHPYFRYIPQMRRDMNNKINTLYSNGEEVEAVDQELVLAQQQYNSLTENPEVPNLLPPTVINACIPEEYEYETLPLSRGDLREVQKKLTQKTVKEKSKSAQVDTLPDTVEIPEVKPVEEPQLQNQIQDNEELKVDQQMEESFCVTGDPEAPPPLLKLPDRCPCYVPNQEASVIITGGKQTPSGHMIPIIQGIRGNTCDCTKQIEEKISVLEAKKIYIQAKLELKKQPNRYIIGGVVSTPKGPVYILGGITPDTPLNQPEKSLKEWRDLIAKFDINKLEEPEIPRPQPQVCEKLCECKEKSQKFLREQCRCEKCKITDRRKNPFFIYGGTSETEEGLTPVISGVCIRKCSCLEDYQQKIQDFEHKKLMDNLKDKLNKIQGHKYIIGGISMTKCGPVFNIQGVKESYKCMCEEIYLQKMDQKYQRQSNYVPDDYFLKKDEDITVKVKSKECRVCKGHYQKFLNNQCSCPRCTEERNKKYGTWIISGSKLNECGYVIPVIGGIKPLDPCDCLKEYEERVRDYEKGLYTRDQMRELRQKNLMIGGLTTGKNGNEFIISGVYEGGLHSYFGDDPYQFLSTEDKQIMEVCKCRGEIERFLNKKCRCEKCLEAMKEKNLEPSMNWGKDAQTLETIEEEVDWGAFGDGMRYSFDDCGDCGYYDMPEPYVPSAKEEIEGNGCECLSKYTEKLRLYEDYKRRMNAVLKMQAAEHQYMIGGVVSTKDGPVYIVSGVKQPIKCPCAEFARKELERNRLMALMPKTPKGRVMYGISGVRETKNGNVFIISGAKTIADCSCLDMFQRFDAAHRFCTDFYEKYLGQMLIYIQEYLADLEYQQEILREEKDLEGINREQTRLRGLLEECRRLKECNDLFIREEPIIPPLDFDVDPEKLYPRVIEDVDEEREGEEEEEGEDMLAEEIVVVEPQIERTKSKEKDKRTSVNEEIIEEPVKKTELVKKPISQNIPLKRFFIIKKFPRDTAKQYELLMSALETLKNDGFHIANLPDCHKLPHFKLWLQMRAKVRWRVKDIEQFKQMTITLSHKHIERCFEHPRIKFPISEKQMKKATWQNSAYYKRLTQETQDSFYRIVKQSMINNAREFYPVLFPYEFFSTSLRNTYFAFTPSKEEEVYPFKVIKPHEFHKKD